MAEENKEVAQEAKPQTDRKPNNNRNRNNNNRNRNN